jgi:hypothetical protein
MTQESVVYRMERAFLKLVFQEINEVQNPRKYANIPKYRKTLWIPKNISNRAYKVS